MEQVVVEEVDSGENEACRSRHVGYIDGDNAVGPVEPSGEIVSEHLRGDDILDDIRYLYVCNTYIMDTVDVSDLCSCGDSGGVSHRSRGFVESRAVAMATDMLRGCSDCEVKVIKPTTHDALVQNETDSVVTEVTPAGWPWKLSLGKCEVTTHETVAVWEADGEKGKTHREGASYNGDVTETETDTTGRCSQTVGSGDYHTLPTLDSELKMSSHCESSSDDHAEPPGGGCENLSAAGSCGSGKMLSGATGEAECGRELSVTEADDDVNTRTTHFNNCVLVDTYENDRGVVMVTQQLQVSEEKVMVSVAVQCQRVCVSVGCQVDLYDSDVSDDVSSSSEYDDESGIDGDTECDVDDDVSNMTQGHKDTHREVTQGHRDSRREMTQGHEDTRREVIQGHEDTHSEVGSMWETGGLSSVVVVDTDGDTDSSDVDDKNVSTQQSMSRTRDKHCESSSEGETVKVGAHGEAEEAGEDEEDGEAGEDEEAAEDGSSQETSQSESVDTDSSID